MDGTNRLEPDDIIEVAQSPGGAAIGQVDSATGKAFVIRVDGSQEPAEAGMPIFQGDEIVTEGDGAMGLVFIDNSTFSIAEDGRMVIDEMVYDPAANEGSSLFNVTQGVFTFVSGEIAKTTVDAMQIETPVATIGIRGTAGGFRITNPQFFDPTSTAPPSGTFSNFNDPITGQPGEYTVTTPTGFATLSGLNATTNVPNPFVPPSPPVSLPPSVIRAAFAAAANALPPPPAQQNNQSDDDDQGGGNQGGGNQGEQGTFADSLTETAPAEGDEAAIQAAVEEAGAAVFNEVLAQGGNIEQAMFLASEVVETAEVQIEAFGANSLADVQAITENLAGEVIGAIISGNQVEFTGTDVTGPDPGDPDPDPTGPDGPDPDGPDPDDPEPEPEPEPEPIPIPVPEPEPEPIIPPTLEPLPEPLPVPIVPPDPPEPPPPDTPDPVVATEPEFIEFITASMGNDDLIGGDGNTEISMDQLFGTLGGDDVVDGGGGIDELTFLNLDDGWLRFDPTNTSQEMIYSFGGGSYTGSVNISNLEQIFAVDTNGISNTDLANTSASINSLQDGIRLGVEITDNKLGFVGVGSSSGDTLSTAAGQDPGGLHSQVLGTGASLGAGDVGGSLLFGGGGNDNLTGSDAGDIILGGADDDTINGGDDQDILVGGLGADTITGGEAADEIVLTNFGSDDGSADTLVWDASNEFGDSVYGFIAGSGGDVIDFNVSTRGSALQTLTSTDTSVDSATGFINYTTDITNYNLATAVASDLSSSSFGGQFSASDTVAFLVGNGASSQLWLWTNGSGNTTIEAGELSQVAFFDGLNNDSMDDSQFSGFSDVFAGNNTIEGTAGNDTINAGAGDDNIYSYAGDDTIDAGADNDTIFVAVSDTSLTPLANTHTGGSIDGGTGSDNIYTYANNDFSGVTISNVENWAFQGTSHDVTFLSSHLTGGITQLQSNGAQTNNLTINMDSTSLDLSSGYSWIGGAGANHTITVNGTASADTIVSPGSSWTSASVALNGGAGNDTLTGSSRTGGETLDGGEDSDVFVFSGGHATSGDVVNDAGASGSDTIRVDGNEDFTNVSISGIELVTMNGASTVTFTASQMAGFSTFTMGTATETLTISYDTATSVNLSSSLIGFSDGTDAISITDSSGNDTYVGAASGGESATLTTGDDNFSMGNGNDTVSITASGLTSADVIGGDGGTDTLVLTGGGTLTDTDFTGVTNFEALTLDDSAYNITLGTEADAAFNVGSTITSNQAGNALTLDASAYTTGGLSLSASSSTVADTIVGTSSADTINVGAGADSITGNGGADNITLGSDAQTVVYNSATDFSGGHDTITNFTAGSGGDVIDYNVAVSNGTSDEFEAYTSGGTLGTDVAVVNYKTDIANYTMATAVADELNNLSGFGFDDDLIFAVGDGSNTRIWQWTNGTNSTVESGELVAIADLNGVDNDNLTADNFAGFSQAQTTVSAFQLGTVSAFAQSTNTVSLSGGFTVEAWVNDDNFVDFAGFFTMQVDSNNFIVLTETGGNLQAEVKMGGTQINHTSSATLPTSTWTHVAFSYDNSGTVQLYINGSPAAGTDTFNNGTPSVSITANVLVGVERNGTSPFYGGDIAEVRLWDTVRTDAEILANYDSILTGSESGLDQYWQLNGDLTNSDSTNSINALTMSSGSATFTASGPSLSSSDPLIMDLDGDGVEMLGLDAGVEFDIDGDGVKENTGWFGPDDGMLVADLNDNGSIDDMTEVVSPRFGFGDVTASNSLGALTQLDENNDGKIDSSDAVWGELSIWRDANSDGITDAGELLSLDSQGITSIGLDATDVNATDNGNSIWREAQAETDGGGSMTVAEVTFASDDAATSDPQDPDTSGLVT